MLLFTFTPVGVLLAIPPLCTAGVHAASAIHINRVSVGVLIVLPPLLCGAGVLPDWGSREYCSPFSDS